MKRQNIFLIFGIISSIILVSNLELSYSSHFADEDFWEKKYKKLIKATKELKQTIKDLETEINELKIENKNREKEIKKIKIENKELEQDVTIMIERGDHFEDLYDESKKQTEELYEYSERLYNELQKPKTTIKGTEIRWEFYDSKENYYDWIMPVKTYEDMIPHSYEKSTYQSNDRYLEADDGSTITTVNLDGFILNSFGEVIDDIYDNSDSNADFIYEVWFIVSQLTVYDLDIDDTSEGRFALETFTRGGGDCEDLTILIADMLSSSKHTEDWDFQYIYFDMDNPTSSNTVNHVILVIDDGEYSYHIESTGKPNWDYYPDGISGWYFDI